MLQTIVVLLAAVVLLIPLSRRAGFGSIVGYLAAGAAIGPAGLRLITDIDEIRAISQFGVVMLLFLIGLELRPQRLWVMRRTVFGLGAAQVLACGAALAGLAHLAGLSWMASGVIGGALALSSTAIVLPMLAERDLLAGSAGRDAFAVLLFQDLAFIPMVAGIPLLSGAGAAIETPWLDVGLGVGAIAVILVGGRFLIRPAFRTIGGARTPEVFNALALLTVTGAAVLANVAGLSMSLGAFLGGVILSDSEYRHELRADIEPFEGLLLGLFFMSVGMSADFALIAAEPGTIAAAVAALLATKILVAYPLGRLFGQDRRRAARFALALPQGSEFSFVLFGAAVAAGALAPRDANRATLAITLSMLATPLLFALSERFLMPHLSRPDTPPPPAYDEIHDEHAPVIICGFGRVGQIVGRLLKMWGVAFTALEQDPAQVETVRRFGNKVYYGDPTRPDLLRAAGADKAALLVVALADMEQTLQVVGIARRNFPRLKIMARARNRRHAHLLMDHGVEVIVRETLHSSLKLGQMVLEAVGVSHDEAVRAADLFLERDESFLRDSHAYYEDERQLIQNAQQTVAELNEILEADRRARARPVAK
jgi:monovalent cation:proton antiporter-2 (CPA2) family protein